jgi:hypothetical protein
MYPARYSLREHLQHLQHLQKLLQRQPQVSLSLK